MEMKLKEKNGKLRLYVNSDLQRRKSAVISNEEIHCYVLAVHVIINPVTNAPRHYVCVLVVVELRGRGWGRGARVKVE